MFDRNVFKQKIKKWINDNESGTVEDLQVFCEQLIPPKHYVSNKWLIEETINWYQHILNHRKQRASDEDEHEFYKFC